MITFFTGISFTAELASILNKLKAFKSKLGSMDALTSKVDCAEQILRSLRPDTYVLDQRMRHEFEAYQMSIVQTDADSEPKNKN